MKTIENSESIYLDKLPADERTIAISSPMGSGKTTRIRELVNAHDGSILMISFRTIFAYFLTGQFPSLVNYLDIPKDELPKQDRIAIQIDSLWRLFDPDRMKPYKAFDLVVLDESESIFLHISSAICSHRSHSILRVLYAICKVAKRVVASDAFMTNRTLEFLRVCRGEDFLYIKHTRSPVKREFVEIESYAEAITRIKACLAKGERLFVCSNSKVKLTRLHDEIHESFKCLLITGESEKQVKAQSGLNCNDYWSNFQCVMASTACSAGLDYSNDSVPFHRVFALAFKLSSPMRLVVQLIGRVRRPVNNQIGVYFLDNTGPEEARREAEKRQHVIPYNECGSTSVDDEGCLSINPSPEDSLFWFILRANELENDVNETGGSIREQFRKLVCWRDGRLETHMQIEREREEKKRLRLKKQDAIKERREREKEAKEERRRMAERDELTETRLKSMKARKRLRGFTYSDYETVKNGRSDNKWKKEDITLLIESVKGSNKTNKSIYLENISYWESRGISLIAFQRKVNDVSLTASKIHV